LGALADDAVRIIFPGTGEQEVAVHGGFVQMTGDHLVVLSDLAELKDDIDVPRAQRAKAEAEQALSRDPEDADAQSALVRAETRIKVATGS
jgi:F-type H+-transporting ATPase subunit epsilon